MLELTFINRFASTIFQQFIASDEASERFAGLKRIHGLMPYFVLKGILKISNPVAMIRGKLLVCVWNTKVKLST